MFQGEIQQSSSGTPLLFLLIQSTDHISGLTGATPTVTISKNGAAFAAPSGAVSEIGNGWYKVAGNATDTGTLGPIALHATAASADPFDDVVALVVAYNPQDATALGLSRIDAAISSRMATFTLPTNFSSLSITGGGAVTVGTNSDKTGYSLTQTFPTNFSSMAISVGGGVAPDWANIKSPTTAVDLSGTTIKNLDGNTVQTGDAYARLGAPAGASVSADIAAVKGVLPTALSSNGNMKSDILEINGNTSAPATLAGGLNSIVTGTVGSSASTTSVPCSSISPSLTVSGQLIGRTLIFLDNTTTGALQGQATTITASTTGATPTLTVNALTTSPVSGDSFQIY